jgi:hypothetical protein
MQISLTGLQVQELAARLGLDYEFGQSGVNSDTGQTETEFYVRLTSGKYPNPVLGIASSESAKASHLMVKSGEGVHRSWHSVLDSGLSGSWLSNLQPRL